MGKEDNVCKKQVLKHINNLKNYKRAGENGIVAEVIKYGGSELQNKVHEIIARVWKIVTTDQIFTVKEINKNCYEHRIGLYIVFFFAMTMASYAGVGITKEADKTGESDNVDYEL